MNNAPANMSDEYFHQTMNLLLPNIHPRLDPALVQSDLIALLFRLGDRARIGDDSDEPVDLRALAERLETKTDSELTDEERQVISAVKRAKVAKEVFWQLLVRLYDEHGDIIEDRQYAKSIITFRAHFLHEICNALECCTTQDMMGDREAVQASYTTNSLSAAALQIRLAHYIENLDYRLQTLGAGREEVYENPMELVNVGIRATDVSRRVPLADAGGEPCPICHEDFEMDGETEFPVRLLSCDHLMGSDCLGLWINGTRHNHNTCPCCRALLFHVRRQYRYKQLERQLMDSFWQVQANLSGEVDRNIPHQKAILRYMIAVLTSYSAQLVRILTDLAP